VVLHWWQPSLTGLHEQLREGCPSGALTLPRAQAIASAAEGQLEGREYAVDSARVLSLARRSGCSAYDCEFVALADDLGARLVSNDAAVLRAFRTIAVPLQDFAPDRCRGQRRTRHGAVGRRSAVR
jgi:hypothetical protein